MNMSMRKTVLNNLTLKIIASIIAYGIWFLLNQSRTISIDVQAPLCFYNGAPTDTVSAPEIISLTLSGKSHDLRTIDLANLACHIDIANLHTGENPLIVSHETLFLPESINLLHYYPSNGCIVVYHANQQSNLPPLSTTQSSKETCIT